MSKSKVIRIIAIAILVIGIIHLVDHFTGHSDAAFPFAGIGNILMGIGLFVLSNKKNEEEN